MSISYYTKNCDGCSGSHALMAMQGYCKKKGVDFQEKRTILWVKWEEEANQIMEINPGLKLPFFYNDETGETISGYSGTPLETLKKLITKE